VTDASTGSAAGALYDGVPGQQAVTDQLRRAAARPVHAYLFVGPPGTGKRRAAQDFAASLLCPDGGDGTCRVCQQARAGTHVDVEVVERTGAFITVDQAHQITTMAARTPVAGRRKVLVLVDFHLVQKAAPALLKTIEEPPASTVFVVLADHVPPELETIASRCVTFTFRPLSEDTIRGALEAEGIGARAAEEAARASGGRLDRARLLALDPDVASRRALWEGVPARLDGTGATVATLTVELLDGIQHAKVSDALTAQQSAELAALAEREKLTGERGSGRKDLEARHKREQRRLRTDELRSGLATLAAAYRDRAARPGPARGVASAVAAVARIQVASEALIRNPNEALWLQALLLGLQRS